MNNIKLYVLMGICVILGLLLFLKSCQLEESQQLSMKNHVPDTVYISKPYKVVEIKTKYIEKPIKVFVYKTDTVFRKILEQSDIITGITYKKGNLFRKLDLVTIGKINLKGEVFESRYELPPLKEIKIDHKGNLQTKKKRYIGLKIIAGVVLTSSAGFFVHREIKK